MTASFSPPSSWPWGRLSCTLIGLALSGVLLWQVSRHEIVDHLHHLGRSFWWILLPYGVGALCDCKGWACSLKACGKTIPLYRLYLARLAGEAVNKLTPTGDIGGEPIKVYLLQTLDVSTDTALASLVITRTALIAGQIIFILLGVSFFLHRLGLLRQGGLVLLPLLGLAYVFVKLLIHVQQKSLLTQSIRRLKWAVPLLEHWEKTAQSIDVQLREFYHTNPRTFLVSTVYALLGWLLGVVELALILFLLGVAVRPADALIIESMVQPLTVTALLIPGALGVKEAGGVFLCQMLGIDQAVGLTLMLLKRASEAVYIAVGLFLLTRMGGR